MDAVKSKGPAVCGRRGRRVSRRQARHPFGPSTDATRRTVGDRVSSGVADNVSAVTVSISINYLSGATHGRVACRTSIDRKAGTLALLRSEVHHEEGKLLARALGTFALVSGANRADLDQLEKQGDDDATE